MKHLWDVHVEDKSETYQFLTGSRSLEVLARKAGVFFRKMKKQEGWFFVPKIKEVYYSGTIDGKV